MKHTVCFIDDKIPVSQYNEFFSDTDIVNESVINFLLKNEGTQWDDPIVKVMCDKLISEKDKWSVSAFLNPSFYDNYVEDNVYAPEIVIYDWDYNWGIGSESEEHLLKILEKSYTLIFIFSESDNIDEINRILGKKIFFKFKDRLCAIGKDDENSVDKIFTLIEQKESDNFSFRYGHELIYKSNYAINKILSEIAQLSIEDFLASMVDEKDGKYISNNEDFVDVIIPRYKKALSNVTWPDMSIKKQKEPSISDIKKVWSYRLYDDNSLTDNVSMGDIVKKEKGGYYLVISSDCHMARFWQKNGGFVSLVPLHRINSTLGKGQRKLIINSKPSLSSVNSSQIPMTILPAVPISSSVFRDFLVLPKNMVSVKVPEPSTGKKTPLTYRLFNGYSKVVSVVDPYKSPLIHFIMDNITGYGCPDFPKAIQNYLWDRIK